jgi:hypothetical protein
MSVNYNPSVVTTGLVLYLDAANKRSYPGSGATWYDVSGLNNHCVWAATPTLGSGYFTFTGTQWGTITNSATLDFSSGQTLIIGMRHSYVSGRKNPWNQAYAGFGTWTHEQGDSISQYFGDGGGDNSPYLGTTSPGTPRNVWNIMCATRDTVEHKWYMNGAYASTTSHTYGVLTNSTANIWIANGYAGLWEGDMAFVMAYNRALTADEVSLNFQAIRGRYGI